VTGDLVTGELYELLEYCSGVESVVQVRQSDVHVLLSAVCCESAKRLTSFYQS
jgi:hypothetical protein